MNVSSFGLGKALGSTTFWALSGQVSGLGTNFVSHMLLARLLGPQDLGSYVLLLSFGVVGSLILQLGLARSAFILITGELAQDNYAAAIRTAMRICFCLAFILVLFVSFYAIFGNIAVDLVFGSQISDPWFLILFPCLSVVANLFVTICAELLRGLERIRSMIGITQVATPVSLLMIYFAAWSQDYALGLTNTCIAYLAVMGMSALALLILTIYGLRKLVALPPTDDRHLSGSTSWQGIFYLSFPIWVENLVFAIQTQFDVWAVSAYLTTGDVAAYNIALKIALCVTISARAIDAATGHLIIRAHTQGDRDGMENLVRSAAFVALAIGSPVALVSIVFPETVISILFGDEFLGGRNALVILATSRLVAGWLGYGHITLMYCGHARTLMVITATSAVFHIGALIVGCALGGLTGAAIANASVFTAQKIATFIFARSKYRIEFLAWPMPGMLNALR